MMFVCFAFSVVSLCGWNSLATLALGSLTTRWTSLVWRPRLGVLQAVCDSSSVSERPHTTVPIKLLRPCHQCWHSAASAFRQPSTTCSTSLPAQHLWPSTCLFSCWPHSLELSPRFHPGPDHQCRLFQTSAWNVFVRSILVHSAQ